MLVHTFFLELAQQLGIVQHEEARGNQGYFYLIQKESLDPSQLTLFRILLMCKKELHKRHRLHDMSPMLHMHVRHFRLMMRDAFNQAEYATLAKHDHGSYEILEEAYTWWQEVYEDFVIDHQLDSTPA